MIWLGYFILFFGALRMCIALVNFLSFHYLRNGRQLPGEDLVSVLIPARNEEATIDRLLDDLAACRYPSLEIIIYDDDSQDNTPAVIRKHAAENPAIRLLPGKDLPPGWIGKNYACFRLAEEAQGRYYLFLDADVRIKPGLIEKAVNHLENYKLSLLSIFPKQLMLTPGEKISVPLMNWILLSLLPLFLIRISGWTSLAAANGQFMLFPSKTYKELQPHQKFRKHPVEDIVILRDYKKLGLKVDTRLGNRLIQCRMYSGLREAMEGFAKNYLQFFGNSMILALLFGILTSLALPLVVVINGWQNGAIYLLIIILTRIFVSLASKQSVLLNLVYMVPQQFILLGIMLKAIVKHKKKSLVWKGRKILGI